MVWAVPINGFHMGTIEFTSPMLGTNTNITDHPKLKVRGISP